MQTLSNTTRLLPGQRTCVMCDTPLNGHQARMGVVCGSASCVWKHQSTPASQRCVVCERVLAREELARRTCSNRACQQEWLIERPLAHRRQQMEQLLSEATAWRDSFAVSGERTDASSYPVLVIPQNHEVSTPLDPARRDALRAHVSRVAMRAFDHLRGVTTEDPPQIIVRPLLPPPSREMGDFLMAACIACRGSCCKSGAEHAYITHHTILAYLEQHPDQSLEQVVDAYLQPVTTVSLSRGCVYQHAEGCSLPRDMRSITCNQYYCEPLYSLRMGHVDGEPLRGFLVAEDDQSIGWGIFATSDNATTVHRPDAAS